MNVKQNPISRREFSTSIVLGGIGFLVLGTSSCNEKPKQKLTYDQAKQKPLNEDQFHTLDAVLNTVFPNDGNGPDARGISAVQHVIAVLNDSRQDPRENQLIIDKLDRFIQYVSNENDAKFYELNESVQQKIVAHVAQSDWGKYWMSRLTTLILEALLSDPMYGVNTDECGWNWLEHQSGQPRPQEKNLYPVVFETHEI